MWGHCVGTARSAVRTERCVNGFVVRRGGFTARRGGFTARRGGFTARRGGFTLSLGSVLLPHPPPTTRRSVTVKRMS
eukprot:832215-Pyramimonas_sp.AAC.1